ncbi:MAG: glycosyltransferase [Gemmatimonadetes bacterium]|nr:glycosyltransferase [Gemmatimonadota bacterium]
MSRYPDDIELSVIVPVYNEADKLEENVRVLHDHLASTALRFEVIVCIDGSTDESFDIAHALSTSLPSVEVVGYPVNRGRGYAIKYAAEHLRGSRVVYMDSDLPSTIDLSHLDTMLSYLERYDIVIASRFHRDAKVKRKWHRAVVSVVYRMIVSVVFPGFRVTDPDVGFKGFQRDVFDRIVPYTTLNGWSWDLEFLVSADILGYSIEEFPFNWVEHYERTSVGIVRDSFLEFIGLLYIRLKSFRLRRGRTVEGSKQIEERSGESVRADEA